ARLMEIPISQVVSVLGKEKGNSEKKAEVPQDRGEAGTKEVATKEEFRSLVDALNKVLSLCPNCGHQLFLYSTHDHSSLGSVKSGEVKVRFADQYWLKETDVNVHVYRGKEYCQLKCIVCGYTADVVMPKSWYYTDEEKKRVDFRNEEGTEGRDGEAGQGE
ncbi:unnamed protein product, partial [marine sediment metagenome]